MAYIRIDHSLTRKPKFRAMLRATGLDEDSLVGKLCRIWRAVDELGNDIHGTPDLVADGIGVSEEVLRAMVAVGWAAWIENGVRVFSLDVTGPERRDAKNESARRSYHRKKGVATDSDIFGCPDESRKCHMTSYDTSIPSIPSIPSIHPIHPSHPSIPSHPANAADAATGDEEDALTGSDAGDPEPEPEPGDVTPAPQSVAQALSCPRKAAVLRHIVPKCSMAEQGSLTAVVLGWPPGEWIWREHQRWRAGATKAKNLGAYYAKCIRSTKPPERN